jgi:hypothetical protein
MKERVRVETTGRGGITDSQRRPIFQALLKKDIRSACDMHSKTRNLDTANSSGRMTA